MAPRHILVALVLLLALSGCSSGEEITADTAAAEGWAWPLTITSGTVRCNKGTSQPEVAIIPDGSDVAFPLSVDALYAVNGGEREYPGSLSSIRNGKPLMPLLQAAWSLACGGSSALGPFEHDVEVLDAKG